MSESSVVPVRVSRTEEFQAIVSLVTDALRSEHSKRAYAHAIKEFVGWMRADDSLLFSKGIVQAYVTRLQRQGLAPSSVNLRLSAIRKLAREGADNGLVAQDIAAAIERIHGVRVAGVRFGNWLSKRQAERLLALPDKNSNKGKRDRVILGLMIGCGLRREELAGLEFERIQEREGRWVILDLSGKGNRIRTIPVPPWADPLLKAWSQVLEVQPDEWSDESTSWTWSRQNRSRRRESTRSSGPTENNLGFGLRRMICDGRAKLAHRGRSPVEQIKFSLGHASVRTTETYLGLQQDLVDAPADHLGLDLPAEPPSPASAIAEPTVSVSS